MTEREMIDGQKKIWWEGLRFLQAWAYPELKSIWFTDGRVEKIVYVWW